MGSESKRRRTDRAPPSQRIGSAPAAKKDRANAATLVKHSTVPAAQTSSGIHLTLQQAKNHAVAEAQREGCTGNFRIFDSPFGNFLVPVIPTRAELGR